MANHMQNDGVKSREAVLPETSEKRNPVRSASFKYYIHDGVEVCRLQLIGDMAETEVANLTGCWNTVKTTLGERKFVLDLHGLRSTDEPAKLWVVRMAAEGANILPEHYIRDGFSAPIAAPVRRSGVLTRLVSMFRRSSTVQASS